jgi:hypothetical protein
VRALKDPGHPSEPSSSSEQIAVAEKEQAEAREWVHAKRFLLGQYSQLIEKEILALKNALPLPGRA